MTGATSGIGLVAAQRLAAMGARLVLIARDRERAASALGTFGPGHSVYYGDLSRIAEMKRAAAEIAAAEPKIDVLINNAGALFNSRHVTEDGLELTFALNHMAYFVVTLGLTGQLRAAGAARVVSTSSDAHKGKRVDFDDLQTERGYRGFGAYGRSKLCNILFTRELARRWAGTPMTANCLHPGFVATRFGDQSGGLMPAFIRFAKLFALSPEKGAQTVVYLASSDEVAGVSGAYFVKCRQEQPTPEAQDDEAARRLWDESARLAGMDGSSRLA
jgi:NAD(P)-dependent dehydrogenase (short-subunit alcohol dehydrogenase family)